MTLFERALLLLVNNTNILAYQYSKCNMGIRQVEKVQVISSIDSTYQNMGSAQEQRADSYCHAIVPQVQLLYKLYS